MKQDLDQLGEFGLIRWIKDNCPAGRSVKQGIGDDTAVLPYSKTEDLLLTTDMTVEGTHFAKRTPKDLVGRKALARNLSDIAAMGGTPTYAVISLGLPRTSTMKGVKDIYRGISELAKVFDVSVVGGDTVQSDVFVINVALLGKVRKGKAVLRSTAQPGDQVFVTGPLGGSLKSGRHLSFMPRVKEARELVSHFRLTAMIDISDGLAGDLGHILRESGVGAVIFERFIPRHRGVMLENALYDGEDFELLFTVSPKDAGRLLASGRRCYHIGEIQGRAKELFLVDQNHQRQAVAVKGFEHFR